MTDPARPSAPVPGRGKRQLRRSHDDRLLGGVCAGIAGYLDVDPVLLRIATLALALSSGFGVLGYGIAWVVIPEDVEDEPDRGVRLPSQHTAAMAVGAALIGLGVVLQARQWMPWSGGAHALWPLLVVAAGVLVLISGRRRKR